MEEATQNLEQTFRLYALQAVPEVERRGVEWEQRTGQKMVVKREIAIDYVAACHHREMARLRDEDVPVVDVRRMAGEAVDWAFMQVGNVVNALSRPSDA